MPWSVTSPMDQKLLFVADCAREHFPVAELCRRYGISRKTGYKWIDRFKEQGPEGLAERSRKPHHVGRRIGHPGRPLTPMTEPNEIWTADFKGHFKTGDGLYCYPLTVKDGFSRYLFGVQACLSPSHQLTQPVFERLFREYGLPRIIRTDNGAPFATIAIGRLSQLSVWRIRLGIFPELIEPAHPEQNARHERMHRTLKAEIARPPAEDHQAQQ